MEVLKRNKGVIIFYLLIIIGTLAIIECNERNINMENRYVYLCK